MTGEVWRDARQGEAFPLCVAPSQEQPVSLFQPHVLLPRRRCYNTGMRVLGLDLGECRVGVAVSDLLGMTAQPLPTFEVTGAKSLLEQVRALVADYEAQRIVVGMPLNEDGTMGPRAQRVDQLAIQLEQDTGLPVTRVDERYTSREAKRILTDAPSRVRKKKGSVDRIAAVLILQAYLDFPDAT